MKDTNEVIEEFNDIVNMTASELEKWLKSGDSRSAGWPKDDGGGESVGHDSGRRIVEILKANPGKDPKKYTDEQLEHMRKVVSYCKRHLAQEEKMMQEKSTEEIKKTKSYASLKNWGHDPLKNAGADDEDGDEEEKEEEEQEEDNEEEQEADEEQAGDKRKKSNKAQSGSNKKRETRQGKATSNGKKDEDDQEEDEEADDDGEYDDDAEESDEGDEEDEEEDGKDKQNGKSNGNGNDSSGKKPKKGPKPGDTVSWNWGNGQPQGKVLDVKGEKTSVETKRGNEVTRDGDPEDPAVVLDTGKSKAIKSNHELVDTED